ncbi:alpha-amylase family glycosyl hydrolase [Sphingomonas qomolangmaensis]|uniref:Alpha-amylase family glycosyl hydrolase n=1 Tax=Sphingomonas qomolangmaensis TaxID=2918765 RepID=A0ABY5L9E8_9SPHN|nr:alpha-amylase family glycosyl hydrolase [Sphingomonas qomolangmaensis]UUL82487.1 alpha-amylase family glycosyl hydrolase [Sphingomonas qomolangmaensis]
MIRTLATAMAIAIIAAPPAAAQQVARQPELRRRLPQDEVIYFVLPDRFANGDRRNDRGGIAGDRLAHGFDPTHKGFFHGGDIKGLIDRLDYIQSLGMTAIWLTPVFKNKPVQGGKGEESAGYHGYWITDFTTVDPHLGADTDFTALVAAAHARGMKVYMDIIANHTADVFYFAECEGKATCAYRSRADFPYATRGGPKGEPINRGFAGDRVMTTQNFARLTDPNYAYTVKIKPQERTIKVPAWLNEPIHYHNRGNTMFSNESSTMGDFVGLDDLMTESPRVVKGMIDIYGDWIDRFGVDGFRIDTARHVNPEFWTKFTPAMLDRAKAKGIPNFHIFGEAAWSEPEIGLLQRHTVVDKLPSVLDFAFATAVQQTVAEGKPTAALAKLFWGDAMYAGGEPAALQLPTFIGNHDQGRFAMFVTRANPQADDAELLARTRLGHEMLLTLRGVPTIYYGDEQGFAGKGNDQDSRQTMFASSAATYLEEKLVGTARTHRQDHFRTDHPLFQTIATLSKLRVATPALRRGRQVTRAYHDASGEGVPGLFAVSRFDPASDAEVVIAFNTSAAPIAANIEVEARSTDFGALYGTGCPTTATAPGSVAVTIAPFSTIVCAATGSR